MMTNVMMKTCLNQKICLNIHRMFRRVDLWIEHTKFIRRPIFSEYKPNVPKCGLNTRHDNRKVTLIRLTRGQTLRSDKCATGPIHTNMSMTINVIPC